MLGATARRVNRGQSAAGDDDGIGRDRVCEADSNTPRYAERWATAQTERPMRREVQHVAIGRFLESEQDVVIARAAQPAEDERVRIVGIRDDGWFVPERCRIDLGLRDPGDQR